MSKFPRAFTLIELLVVMSIIAVLMGLLFPVANSVMENLRKTQTKNTMMGIVTAVAAYRTEYGSYPVELTGDGDAEDAFLSEAGAQSQRDFFDILRSQKGTGGTYTAAQDRFNPKRISFISLSLAKNLDRPKNGLDREGRLRDPWGGIFRIRVDSNSNNHLECPYAANAGADASGFLTMGVIVWSLGKDGDGAINSTGASDKMTGVCHDDVISWE